MIVPVLSSKTSLMSLLSLYALCITTNKFQVVDAATTPIAVSPDRPQLGKFDHKSEKTWVNKPVFHYHH